MATNKISYAKFQTMNMASSSKTQSSSTMSSNQKPGNGSIASQPKRQDRNTGGMVEAAKKGGRTSEDDQETEAPSTKRQAVAGNVNNQVDARVPDFILEMSSKLAELDAITTAISKFKTNTGHFEVAMKSLFENTVEQELESGSSSGVWYIATTNSSCRSIMVWKTFI